MTVVGAGIMGALVLGLGVFGNYAWKRGWVLAAIVSAYLEWQARAALAQGWIRLRNSKR